ncbi:MAG: HAD-IIA family hydrolase [Blautia sp.]|nr:HAD-IIA family hydrolase [Lachnoclostridium sp.]MCM1211209.1 HAD-IIA family hydrolase [Blautia sp.]
MSNPIPTNTPTPEVNQDPDHILDKIRCFALDMDGTVYLGEKWIEGAQEFLRKIEESGRQYVFLTNNSSKNAEAYVKKLYRMGWEVRPEQIVTSGQAAISYLQKHFPGRKVFLLGNPLLQAEFEQAGILLDDEKPEVVMTAFDTSLTYEKLCKVCDFVREGLPYLATHPDYNCPTETGFIPDIGAIHELIHASAFRYPDRIIGKPNGDIVEYLVQRTGIKREETAMVGDRLYTDIATGRNNGLKSILVLSGEAALSDVGTSGVMPHLIFSSVRDMIPFLVQKY